MKTSPYTQLLIQMSDVDEDMKSLRFSIKALKDQISNVENLLIESSLKKDKLKEAILKLKEQDLLIDEEENLQEQDGKRFSDKFPNLISGSNSRELEEENYGIWDVTHKHWCLFNNGRYRAVHAKAMLDIIDYRKVFFKAIVELRTHTDKCLGDNIFDCCEPK
jgi:hypothetical protein